MLPLPRIRVNLNPVGTVLYAEILVLTVIWSKTLKVLLISMVKFSRLNRISVAQTMVFTPQGVSCIANSMLARPSIGFPSDGLGLVESLRQFGEQINSNSG